MQRALEMPAEKIIQLNAALAHHAIPFAFGGAIARNYYADIRTTTDIDAGIFLPPGQNEPVLSALITLFPIDVELMLTRPSG